MANAGVRYEYTEDRRARVSWSINGKGAIIAEVMAESGAWRQVGFGSRAVRELVPIAVRAQMAAQNKETLDT